VLFVFGETAGARPAVPSSHRPKETDMAQSENYEKGREMRRQLLGDAYIERAGRTSYSDPIMRKFIDVAMEGVFGTLWTRPGLDLKTRTLVTVVSDAATGREAELAIHLRMALRQGWTEEELTEALIHLVGYVGAPLVRDALLAARDLFAEVKKETGG
jgi:4-carboxymuconolactone decarboxylase